MKEQSGSAATAVSLVGRVLGFLPDWTRLLLAFLATAAIWWRPGKGLQDALLAALVLWGLPRWRVAWAVWRRGAGLAFFILLLFSLLTIPLSSSPRDSLRAAMKVIDVFALAFMMPALFPNRPSVERLLALTASAFTLFIGCDFVRLAWRLRGNLLRDAHGYEPFFIVHSNVSSMLSGAALLALVYLGWRHWRRKGLRLAIAGGLVLHVGYIVVMASRGPQLALASCLLTSGLVLMPGFRLRALWIALVLAVGLSLLLWGNPRFRDTRSLRKLAGRETVWNHTLALCSERPWLGYGIGGRLFRNTYHQSNPPRSPFPYYHPHNYWLFVQFSQGLPGLFLHLASWAALTWRLLRYRRFADADPAARLLAVTLLMGIQFIFFYSLADWPSTQLHILLLWLIPTALVVSRPARQEVLV